MRKGVEQGPGRSPPLPRRQLEEGWSAHAQQGQFHFCRSPLTLQMLIGLFEPPPQTIGDKVSTNKNGKRPAHDTSEELSKVGGWVYVGSHNFSQAAWVRMQ